MGLEKFREFYGFQSARSLNMYLNGRGPFEARPLIAAAYAHMHRLTPADFMNNDAHDFLKSFKFSTHELGIGSRKTE